MGGAWLIVSVGWGCFSVWISRMGRSDSSSGGLNRVKQGYRDFLVGCRVEKKQGQISWVVGGFGFFIPLGLGSGGTFVLWT